jgi:predicted Zn finger-like uncharacterized protein
MILTCPSCGTQYVVKDDAVPPGGRQVRCASCKHSWHQDPEPVAEAEPEEESIAEATLIEPRSGPEAEERAFEEAVVEGASENPAPAFEAPAPMAATDEPVADRAAEPVSDWREPPQAEADVDDDFSPFSPMEEVAPKRRSPLLTILLIALLVAALVAAFWFLAPPEYKARLGIGAGAASPLALVTTHMDRQRLESGNELLTVTGRVINPTRKEQSVPPLQAQLKSRAGQVVYSWTIAPPARSLPPGASASFNSAEVNVPPGGDELTITLGSPKA